MTPLFKLFALLFVLCCGVFECAHSAPGDTDEFVTGILAIPYKWHLSDKSLTAGSTVGGYLGYQTKTYHDLTITPILGGGLSMINRASPGALESSLQTGVSIASGLIGRVGPNNSNGVQIGLILGCDWLGRSQRYAYEGKPWIAFEVGYSFSL